MKTLHYKNGESIKHKMNKVINNQTTAVVCRSAEKLNMNTMAKNIKKLNIENKLKTYENCEDL